MKMDENLSFESKNHGFGRNVIETSAFKRIKPTNHAIPVSSQNKQPFLFRGHIEEKKEDPNKIMNENITKFTAGLLKTIKEQNEKILGKFDEHLGKVDDIGESVNNNFKRIVNVMNENENGEKKRGRPKKAIEQRHDSLDSILKKIHIF